MPVAPINPFTNIGSFGGEDSDLGKGNFSFSCLHDIHVNHLPDVQKDATIKARGKLSNVFQVTWHGEQESWKLKHKPAVHNLQMNCSLSSSVLESSPISFLPYMIHVGFPSHLEK